ncbi:MAG: chromosomal replication initiator protein DnaA [Eubacteriaceae bacterium]|nr:chromosomal replication initiator protein DnaA [Eubacteriaceae bacterium]
MTSNITEYWSVAKSYIEEELSPVVFHEYIEPLIPVYFSNDVFVLKMEEGYKISLIEQQYHFLIIKALRYSTGGKNIQVKYVADESEYSESAMAVPVMEAPSPQGAAVNANANILEVRFNPRYTFDSFVVGSNNRLAHAASYAVAQHPGKKYNPLFIYGGVGLGKTHLMQAIAQQALGLNPNYKVSFVSSEKFTNEFIDAIRKESNLQFRNKYRNVDMLLVDDIQFLSGKEGTQEEFFHTFNDLYGSEKQIILTSDKPPKEIPNLEERLRSRFEWGLSCDITPPNFETRVAILRKKAEDINFLVNDSILEYIANQIESNIRELEGALLRVKMLQDLEGTNVTTNAVIENLKGIINPSEKKVSIETIIQTVARNYNISYNDIMSQKRTSSVTNPRQIAMYLSRELTEMSLQAVGDNFGGRDYSTVIHSCAKVKQKMDADPSFYKEVMAVVAEIKSKS